MLSLFSVISLLTGGAAPEISSVLQAPQSIVPPSMPDNRLIGQSNQGYIQSLQGLEGSVKNLSLNPTSANDPAAAAPVVQAALAAEQAAETLRNGFVPDPGGLDKTSFALLEAPIESTKNLAAQAPANAAGGGARAFCAQVGPVLAKFPFNPQSATEATPEEVAQIFSPGTGSFTQFTGSLKALVAQQGTQYVVAPGSAVHINPAFLGFLSNAQKISSTLFPSGGNQPSLDFALTEVKSPGAPDAVLNIDNQQITAAGQKTSFHWVSKPDGKYSLASGGNASASSPGPWSVFHFGFAATHIPPDQLKYSLQLNSQTNGVVLFDASGPGAFLLNPQFMKDFHCVSNVAR